MVRCPKTGIVVVKSVMEAVTAALLISRLGWEASQFQVLVYGNGSSMPDDLVQSINSYAPDVADWKKVENLIFDVGVSSIDVTTLLEETLSGSAAGYIITDSLFSPPNKALFDLFPQAKILLFDNGLASHEEKRVVVRKEARQGRFVRRCDLERLEVSAFTIQSLAVPSYIPSEKVIYLDHNRILEAFDVFGAEVSTRVARYQHDDVDLILGSSFSRSPDIMFEDERMAHLQLVERLKSSSRTIVFKPHPRMREPALLTEQDGVYCFDTHLPAEALARHVNVKRAFSVASSALLTLNEIFGIEVHSFGHSVVEPLVRKNARSHIAHAVAASPDFLGSA